MVKIIVGILIFAQLAFASSTDLAYLAKKYFLQGRYGDSYEKYSLALKETRKEGDIASEGRILTSMATLATHAMEYDEAKKLFEQVHFEALDNKGKEDFCKAYMEFYNLQGEYKKSFEFAKKQSFKKASASFLGEASVAAAGNKNNKEADSYLKKIDKSDAPGQLAFYKAKTADLKGENAKELYEKALKYSVEKKRYFTTAIILQSLFEITNNKDYAKRSAAVFKELGLAKPYQKIKEKIK